MSLVPPAARGGAGKEEESSRASPGDLRPLRLGAGRVPASGHCTCGHRAGRAPDLGSTELSVSPSSAGRELASGCQCPLCEVALAILTLQSLCCLFRAGLGYSRYRSWGSTAPIVLLQQLKLILKPLRLPRNNKGV